MSAREEGIHQLSLPDIERRVANMIRYGKIMAVDLPGKRVRVKSGNIESDWLRWPAGRAGAGKRRWDPPEVGEQVVMLAPTGDLSQATFIPGLYQDDYDAPSSDAKEDLAEYDDGTVIGYNRETHTLTVNLGDSSLVMTREQFVLTVGASVLTITPDGTTLATPALTVNATLSTFNGNATVTGILTCAALAMTGAGGGAATLNGNLTVNGNVATTGTLTNNSKNVGSTHTHGGVSAGGGTSGVPT